MKNIIFWILILPIGFGLGYLYYKISLKIIFGKLRNDLKKKANE